MTQIQINRETEEAARKPLAVIEFCRYLTNRQDQANQQNRTLPGIPSAPGTARAKHAPRNGNAKSTIWKTRIMSKP